MEQNKEMLEKVVSGLIEIFGERISNIILYGSVAKGTQTEESDVDIAVITENYTKEMHDKMTDCMVEIELEYNKVLSVLLINNDKFSEWGEIIPFYKNVRKEGICLWPVA